MRRMPALVALATGSSALLLTACGESGVQVASSSPTPSQSAAPAPSSMEPEPTAEESSPTPAPVGAPFIDVVDQSLAPYSALIGSSASAADLGAALPLFDGDVPLPSTGIVGAGRLVERWGDALDATQQLGLDATPSKDELEAYGGAAPAGWAYNSISTTDSSSSLVMTRDSDGLRIVYVAFKDPAPGQPKAEFSLEGNASEIPQPVWLASLPIPNGGELTSVGEGIGEVELNYIPAGSGLVTATWQFPSDQLQALQEYYAGDALAEAGFAFVDPDAIRVGASYFDVVAGDWTGQVIVGELIDGEESFASVQWLLTRS